MSVFDPKTKAGQLLVAWDEERASNEAMAAYFGRGWRFRDVIWVIEAEARAQGALHELRCKVEALPKAIVVPHPDAEGIVMVIRSDVLDLLGDE